MSNIFGTDTLFIPNKSMKTVDQPGYGTDMRTIEQWAANLGFIKEITTDTPDSVTITNPTGPTVIIDVSGGGGGGYSSLTGAGEDASPGDLVQAGGFTVDDSESHGITLESINGAVKLKTSGSGDITLQTTDTGIISMVSAEEVEITCSGSGYPAFIAEPGFVGLIGEDITLKVDSATGTLIAANTSQSIFEVKGSGTIQGEVGFFNVTPVGQAATPSTLADVITILQNLGLCA